MVDHSRRPLAAVLAGLIACVLTGMAAPADASLVTLVTVTANEMHSHCMDPWCGKPDMFARVYLVRRDGTAFKCQDGPIVMDRENVIEDQVICSAVSFEGDFKVRFEAWDFDGPSRLDSEQIPLGTPPEYGWTIPNWMSPGPGLNGYFITSGSNSWAKFTLETAPADPTITLGSATTATFDPSVGERALIAGTINYASRLQFSIDLPAGPYIFAAAEYHGQFSASWDGRDHLHHVVPPGTYNLTVLDQSVAAGNTPATATGTITIAPAASPRLRFDHFAPLRPEGWDFSAGPVTIVGTATDAGRPVLTVAPGACADKLPVVRSIPFDVTTPGVFEVDWDGTDTFGVLAGYGTPFCLVLAGPTAQGTAYDATQAELEVLPWPTGLKVMASLNPVAPALATATPVSIRAFAVDSAHADRYAETMTLTVAAAPPIGGTLPFSPVIVTQTCTRTGTCTWPLPASLAGESAIVWRVTATEARFPGSVGPVVSATTGFRITDLTSTTTTTRVDVPANVTPPIIGPSFVAQAPTSVSVDVAFYPGTGLSPGDPTGGTAFLNAIDTAVRDIKGFDTSRYRRHRSSIVENWGNVAIWAVKEGVTVGYGSGGDCNIGGPSALSFADSVGVLHSVYCRDNSNGRTFTSRFTRTGVVWHELHHAAYDESDEYCCDGGYEDGVNVYSDISSCTAKSSNALSCEQIEEKDENGMVTNWINWWRSDPEKIDVMGSTNDFENPDDRRAAKNTFDRCRRGGC